MADLQKTQESDVEPVVGHYTRRSLLKGSVTLTAAAIAVPVLALGAIETAAPAVEQITGEMEEWFETVGGI